MTLLILEIIAGLIGTWFLLGLVYPPNRKRLLDWFNVSVMLGLISMGLLAYALVPSIVTSIQLVSMYSPHAYNLILWPTLCLVVLRKRFDPAHFLLAFAFVYALDEMIWNVLATLRFWGQWSSTLAYLFGQYWDSFLAVLICVVVVGYLVLRPTLKPNLMWVMLAAFGFVWAWIAGFPTLAVADSAALSLGAALYRTTWEIMWQVAFWVFVWATVFPRENCEQLIDDIAEMFQVLG